MDTHVRLREVDDADLERLFEQQLDPEATRMAAFPPRRRDAFFAHWEKIRRDPAGMVRAIDCDGRLAGNVLSFTIEDRRWVGYWLGREFWGRGIATRALSEYLALETTRPLFAHVAKHNFGSIRVLKKCGFRIEAEDAVRFGEAEIAEWVMRLDS